jgi:hypothetical protein
MGRLHPNNYLDIGPRPNRIGGTSGQYSTFSGQLMLLPPSLRGLGQAFEQTNFGQYVPPLMGSTSPFAPATDTTGAIVATQFGTPSANSGYTINPDGSISATSFITSNQTAAAAQQMFGTPPSAPGTPQPTTTNLTPWLIGGVAALVLLMGMASHR